MFNLLKRIKNGTTAALSTTAAVVLTDDNNRGRAIVQNLDTSINVWVGPSTVSNTAGGVKIAPGETWPFLGRGKLYAASASGTPNIGLTSETIQSNDVKRLTHAVVAAGDTATVVSAKNNKKVKTTVQNLSSSTVWVGNALVIGTGGGVSLAAGKRQDFDGIDAIYAVGPGTNEVQLVTIVTGSAGTFTLSFGGQTTGNIAFGASTSTVQTALRALSTIGSTGCTVGGSAGAWTVTFTGPLANTNVALLTIDPALLTAASSSISTTTQGASTTYSMGVTTQSRN